VQDLETGTEGVPIVILHIFFIKLTVKPTKPSWMFTKEAFHILQNNQRPKTHKRFHTVSATIWLSGPFILKHQHGFTAHPASYAYVDDRWMRRAHAYPIIMQSIGCLAMLTVHLLHPCVRPWILNFYGWRWTRSSTPGAWRWLVWQRGVIHRAAMLHGKWLRAGRLQDLGSRCDFKNRALIFVQTH
jgi:hypothetical protein